MSPAEQRVLSAIHRIHELAPLSVFGHEEWKVSAGHGKHNLEYEARVTHSEAAIQFNWYGVKCELVWSEGELTVSKSPVIDGVRVYQDQMHIADTNTAGVLGEIARQAHKATEEYVKDRNAELQSEHAELVASHQGAS